MAEFFRHHRRPFWTQEKPCKHDQELQEKQTRIIPVRIPLKGNYHSNKELYTINTIPRVHLSPWSTDTWVKDQKSGGRGLPRGSSACLASLRRAAANPEWADWDAGLPLGTIEPLRGDGVRGLTVAVVRVAVEIMPNDGDFGSWLMPERDGEMERDISSNKQEIHGPHTEGLTHGGCKQPDTKTLSSTAAGQRWRRRGQRLCPRSQAVCLWGFTHTLRVCTKIQKHHQQIKNAIPHLHWLNKESPKKKKIQPD